MKMENIQIEAIRPDYMVVYADTKRFGEHAVMFEGNTWNQCFEYLKRELKKETIRMTAFILHEAVTDREGRSFPWLIHVVG